MLTGEAHGLLCVFEIGGVRGVVAGFAVGLGDAVLDQDAGDADGVEPVAGVGALAIGYKDAITSSREDKNGGPGVLAVRGIDGEAGGGDVGEAHDAMAAKEVVGGFGGVGLGFGGLSGLWRGVGPQRECDWLSLRLGGGGVSRCDEECEGDQAENWGDTFHADHTIPRSAKICNSYDGVNGKERCFGGAHGIVGRVGTLERYRLRPMKMRLKVPRVSA